MTPRSSTPAPNSSEVDTSPILTGIVVNSQGQLKVSLELDHDLVPVKTLKLPGNNMFYQQLQEKAFSLFAPTIRTNYKFQNKGLKNDLMQHMINLFGPIFNQKSVQTIAGKYLKSVRDNYGTNIGKYPNYERPGLILEQEWDALVEDAKVKRMRKEGTLPPSALETPRFKDTTKATQARIDKIGQHKLGPGGYVKVKGRYAADFGGMPTDAELKVALKGGYKALVEMKKSNATNVSSTINEEVVHEDIDVPQEPFLEEERTAHLEVTPTTPAVDADHCMRPPSRKHMWRYQLDQTLEEIGREESEGVDTDLRIVDLLRKKKPRKK